MRATFERGDPSAPRGHALVYFRDSHDPDRIRASYLVIAPIEMDLAKYVPPMFAGQLSGMMPSGPTALPLPPVPEEIESLAWLERLAHPGLANAIRRDRLGAWASCRRRAVGPQRQAERRPPGNGGEGRPCRRR